MHRNRTSGMRTCSARAIVLGTLCVAACCTTTRVASAALIATYELVPLSPTTILPGQSITVQVNLTTQDDSVGAGFYFSELTAAGFVITGVSRPATPYTDL
jgi:hypothetical protein